MSQNVKKHFHMLKYLCGAKPKTQKGVIDHCDSDLLDALCECSLNILNDVVPVKPQEIKKLAKYKNNLRGLAKKSTSKRDKKALLLKGGFLQALLTPLLSVLGGILS